MNKLILITFLSAMLFPFTTFADASPNNVMLPNAYPVYFNGNVVINHPATGFMQKIIPTNNDYTNNPGCYLACYSHNVAGSVYPVGKTIFMMGQVRVPGTYVNRRCIPTNQSTPKIAADKNYRNICNQKIPSCAGGCWAGGDTGGWFGIQLPAKQAPGKVP